MYIHICKNVGRHVCIKLQYKDPNIHKNGVFTLFLMTESLGGKQMFSFTTIYFYCIVSLVTVKYLKM